MISFLQYLTEILTPPTKVPLFHPDTDYLESDHASYFNQDQRVRTSMLRSREEPTSAWVDFSVKGLTKKPIRRSESGAVSNPATITPDSMQAMRTVLGHVKHYLKTNAAAGSPIKTLQYHTDDDALGARKHSIYQRMARKLGVNTERVSTIDRMI
jgi:hypothetical protein